MPSQSSENFQTKIISLKNNSHTYRRTLSNAKHHFNFTKHVIFFFRQSKTQKQL